MKKKKVKLIERTVLVIVLATISSVLCIPMFQNLRFGLDLQGGFEVLYQVESTDGSKLTPDMLTNTYKTIGKRIDVLGVSEPTIIVEGENKIRVGLAGITDIEQARNLLSKAANLTFRDTNDQLLMTSSVLKSGKAKVSQDSYGRPAVSLSVKDNDTFYQVTKKLSEQTDKRIVIWLDFEEGVNSFAKEKDSCGSTSNSRCLSVAGVSQGFASDVIIQGNFTQEEVKSLVELINSGSLPTKLTEISSKTVDASFGKNTLDKTFQAGVIGIALIMLTMTLTYRFAGFIASIGILLYTLITLFIFWLVGGVLTLPGIAAIVIGIGMAVDACVISFSRMKDEQKNGENLKNAFKKGNKNSFMTILDANLTTLIVAIILFLFGESSVKGFATMLIISILVTLFVMVFVMRWLLKLFIETDYFNEHWNYFIGNIKKKQNQFDFLKHRNKMWIGFIILFLIGTILLTTQGLKLGVDFKGGTVINVGENHTLEKEKIQKEIETKNYTIYEVEAQDEQSLTLKIEETLTKEEVLQLQTTIQNNYQASTDIGVVSNIVKQELIKNAFLSLILAAIGMIIYVSIRFEWTYAVCGIIALLHDVLMILFAFCLFKLEISSIFIAAILSIVGYSINDTIVVFDRIRENIKTKQIIWMTYFK